MVSNLTRQLAIKFTKVSGKRITEMALVLSTMMQVKSYTKATGKTTKCKAKERYLMKKKKSYTSVAFKITRSMEMG